MTCQPTQPDDALRGRLRDTVWDPSLQSTFPDMLDAEAVVNIMQEMFDPIDLPRQVWAHTEHRLRQCDLRCLQLYAAWRRRRGETWQQLGPTPIFGRLKSMVFAGHSGQRYAPASSRGLDHLLPPGLGPEEHMRAAAGLPTPFRPRDWPEPDVGFVVEAICTWQDALPLLAVRQRQALRTLKRATAELQTALASHRSASADMVAQDKCPAFVAAMSALLRWPDKQQPRHLLQGYPIVGQIEPCGVFREIHQDDKLEIDHWLGQSADDDLESLIRSRPPRHCEEILAITQEEMAKKFCSPLYTKRELDDKYGVGRWRCLERFMILQSDGKKRVIDNGRKSGHNSHTEMQETITTVSVDFIATTARMISESLGLDPHSPESPETPLWLAMRLGTDDLPDAYRGLPVATEHLPFSTVAIFDPSCGWRFTILYGLAYGLEAAVVAFNRFPQLGIAIVRRCLMGLAAAYFDDELSVECIKDCNVTQVGLQMVFKYMGAPPQAAKSFAATANRRYLGTSVHVGEVFSMGFVRFQPKASTSHKVLSQLTTALTTATLDRDTAGKLRGDLNWMWTMCAGYVGKLAGPTLTAKQASSCPMLDDQQLTSLRLLSQVVQEARPSSWTFPPISHNLF